MTARFNNSRTAAWPTILERLSTPESLAGAGVIAFWALLAGLGIGSLVAAPAAVVIAVGVHFATIETGRHTMVWASTGLLLLLIVVTGKVTFDFGPMVFALSCATALAYSELVRLSHARRREATIDDEIPIRAARAVGAAAAGSLVLVAVGRFLTQDEGRNWLWMPGAALAVTLAVVLLTTLPTWRAPEPERGRWQPGERRTPKRIDGAS